MLFNSLQFAIFLPLVVATFYVLPHRARWVMLLAASYYFYMCWRPAYAALMFTSTVVAYVTALGMEYSSSSLTRRGLLAASFLVNLGILFLFKYFNLFATTLNEVLHLAGASAHLPLLDVLLPVGISFYTFQTLSYTVDVYRRAYPAERHFGLFALYVSFFPQLVAGPIERPDNLLPQLRARQRFSHENIENGLRLLLWGFFKKLVIADRAAIFVNHIYAHSDQAASHQLVLATYLFAFQIYCDFSGYTDIAMGSAQLMGFTFRRNFNTPYFSRSIPEFWSRWHMSLSTWFRDYLYLPLGGSRCSPLRWAFNIVVVFMVSGLWHGANWTFVVWGALHALYYLAHRWYGRTRGVFARADGPANRLKDAVAIMVTFHAVLLSWVFFRAASCTEALAILYRILPWNWVSEGALAVPGFGRFELFVAACAIAMLLLVEALEGADIRTYLAHRVTPLRWAYYYATFLAVLNFGMFHNPQQFIYFQF